MDTATATHTEQIDWTDDGHQAYIALIGGAIIVKIRCPHTGPADCWKFQGCRVADFANEATDEELWDDTAENLYDVAFPAPLLWGWSKGEPIITPKRA